MNELNELADSVIWLKELNKNKANIAGVKAAYLGDLYNKNFPVPNGFVISADAFKEFLHSNNLNTSIKKILKELNYKDFHNVLETSEKIKAMIMKENISPALESEILEAYENLNVSEELLRVSNNVLNLIKKGRSNAAVSVRSSSVLDIPGACSNYLNIIGNKNLINSIKSCWSSSYSVGNLFYLKKNKIDTVSAAVLVQKMVDINKSGVVLSSNPMNREREMVIEAGFGLGQLITQGEITPDIYILDNKLEVKEQKIGNKKLKLIRDVNTNETVRKRLIEEYNKRVLEKWEIDEIAGLAAKIEKIYGQPVAVEFGLGKKLELFHVRILNAVEIIDKDKLSGEILVNGRGASPKISTGIVSSNSDISGVVVKEAADSELIGNLDNIKGVVVNEGSLGSCFAILCRQHGIPFVIAENSTALLNHGLLVTVDGVNGKVYKGEVKAREEKIKIAEDTYGFEVLDL